MLLWHTFVGHLAGLTLYCCAAGAAAFRSGAVMGFMLAGLGLLNLFIAIVAFQKVGGSRLEGRQKTSTGTTVEVWRQIVAKNGF